MESQGLRWRSSRPRSGPLAPTHGVVHALALFCAQSVITEIIEACFRLQPFRLLFFLSETLWFKKKINIGFGFFPRGNTMQFILCFREKC